MAAVSIQPADDPSTMEWSRSFHQPSQQRHPRAAEPSRKKSIADRGERELVVPLKGLLHPHSQPNQRQTCGTRAEVTRRGVEMMLGATEFLF
jgi:hypothetical protein